MRGDLDGHPGRPPAGRGGPGGAITVVHRSAALAALCASRRAVAVAGTHGKTTTSALLATVLDGAGTEPGWVVEPASPGSAATPPGAVTAEWLVVEADESDGTFLALGAHAGSSPTSSPTTSSTGAVRALRGGLRAVRGRARRPRGAVRRRPRRRALVAAAARPSPTAPRPAPTTASSCDRAGTGVRSCPAPRRRSGSSRSRCPRPRAPQRPQRGRRAGHGPPARRRARPTAVAALAAFAGVARRFERRGEVGGVTFVDDYDHLPTEVAAALAAARPGLAAGRVRFQPHRYSRTEALGRRPSPTPSPMPTCCRDRRLPRRRGADRPGCQRQARRRRRPRRPPVAEPSPTCPAWTTWSPTCRRPAPGRPVPHARGRRPDHGARSGPG
jgi:UDP-N-acetylmuramate--alanine ligase